MVWLCVLLAVVFAVALIIRVLCQSLLGEQPPHITDRSGQESTPYHNPARPQNQST